MLLIRRVDEMTAAGFGELLERLDVVNRRFAEVRAKLAATAAALENRALIARRQAEDSGRTESAA